MGLVQDASGSPEGVSMLNCQVRYEHTNLDSSGAELKYPVGHAGLAAPVDNSLRRPVAANGQVIGNVEITGRPIVFVGSGNTQGIQSGACKGNKIGARMDVRLN